MGVLNRSVHLDTLLLKYNISNYIETGVGDGTSLSLITPFDSIKTYGIELDEKFAPHYKRVFPNTVFIFGYSKDCLRFLLSGVDDNPTLFWLDAHYPGSDYKGAPYDSEKMIEKRVPLETELNIISKNRNITNDVFIIDDLRIYKDIPGAPWELKEEGEGEFINSILEKTHKIIEVHAHQGYAIALPKSCNLSNVEIEEEIINR